MKRGIIRIVTGVLLLILQVLSMIGQSVYTTVNLWFYIGLYSPAITGVLLLIFGVRAYRNKLYSQLVLHSSNKKIHTIIKWAGFAISTLLLVGNIISFITDLVSFDILVLYKMASLLAFAVYTLFYMYKKPSCLFSTALIFIGVSYIYTIIKNAPNYIMYLVGTDYYIPYMLTGILPNLVAGIMYIVVATIIYKERFSVLVIKSFGWMILVLELVGKVVANIILFKSVLTGLLAAIPNLLFALIIVIYISVLKLNSLRKESLPTASAKAKIGGINYSINSISICLSGLALLSIIIAMFTNVSYTSAEESWNLTPICLIFLLLYSVYIAMEITARRNGKFTLSMVVAPILAVFALITIVGYFASSTKYYGDPSYHYLHINNGIASLCNSIFVVTSFLIPIIRPIPAVISLVNKMKLNYYSSLKYRVKCYRKVAVMKEYLEKGIISREEYEKNKKEITKNIRP